MTEYYLSVKIGDEWIERKVTLEEYCRAERQSGFYPKNVSCDKPEYWTTPATSGFGVSGSVSVKGYVSNEDRI